MKKGSIVECINDHFDEKALTLAKFFPIKGHLYIVRAILLDDFSIDQTPGILLEEIVNPMSWKNIKGNRYLLEIRFRMSRFREVQPPVDLQKLEESIRSNELT
ncbi:MAG TPA: hypothetical protein PLG08_12460 [Chitinophagaceae bacterium]|nr:hypothetical protein [Chitinophagaceae bacterium]